jgi:hypothetical protein
MPRSFNVTSLAALFMFIMLVACGNSLPTSNDLAGQLPDMTAVEPVSSLQITNLSAAQNPPGIMTDVPAMLPTGQLSAAGLNGTIRVAGIIFTQVGSVSSTDVYNNTLRVGTANLASVRPSSDGRRTIFNYDLSADPLLLNPGENKLLQTLTLISSGIFRSFQLTIERPEDITAYDVTTGRRITPTLNTGSFPLNLSYISIEHGRFTAVRDNTFPSPGIAIAGKTNQPAGGIFFTAAGEAFQARRTIVLLNLSGGLTYSQIHNLRFIDWRTGIQQGDVISAPAASNVYSFNFLVPADGSTQALKLMYDLDKSAPKDGTFDVIYTGIAAQGRNSLQSVNSPDVKGGTLIVQ